MGFEEDDYIVDTIQREKLTVKSNLVRIIIFQDQFPIYEPVCGRILRDKVPFGSERGSAATINYS